MHGCEKPDPINAVTCLGPATPVDHCADPTRHDGDTPLEIAQEVATVPATATTAKVLEHVGEPDLAIRDTADDPVLQSVTALVAGRRSGAEDIPNLLLVRVCRDPCALRVVLPNPLGMCNKPRPQELLELQEMAWATK